MGYSHSFDSTNVMYSNTTTHFDVEQYISETIASGGIGHSPFAGQVRFGIRLNQRVNTRVLTYTCFRLEPMRQRWALGALFTQIAGRQEWSPLAIRAT